jgi:hypothetical protein
VSGNSFLLDTNVVLNYLGGDQTLATAFDQKSLYTSTITELELLSYPEISEKEEQGIMNFLLDLTIIELNDSIKEKTQLFTPIIDFVISPRFRRKLVEMTTGKTVTIF